MSKIDLFAPITRLSGLGFVDEGKGTWAALYPPNLTTDQILEIPITADLPGAIVFNTNTEELETYTAAGFWLPILTAESSITVEEITAEIGNLDTINCITLNSVTINNSGKITTLNFESTGSLEASTIEVENSLTISASGTLNCTTCFVNDVAFIDNGVMQTALAGGTGNNDDSPLTISLDVGAGTGATATIKGSLTSGIITINTGLTPASAAVIATFTIPAEAVNYFSGSYGMIMTPASTTTTDALIYVTTANNLILFGTSSVLAASTVYKWNYHIIGTVLSV
jgi:hypothetical protein